jgi:hypothetical protein
MIFLLDLPSDCLQEIFQNFFHIPDIAKLDSAFCNVNQRLKYLNEVSATHLNVKFNAIQLQMVSVNSQRPFSMANAAKSKNIMTYLAIRNFRVQSLIFQKFFINTNYLAVLKFQGCELQTETCPHALYRTVLQLINGSMVLRSLSVIDCDILSDDFIFHINPIVMQHMQMLDLQCNDHILQLDYNEEAPNKFSQVGVCDQWRR